MNKLITGLVVTSAVLSSNLANSATLTVNSDTNSQILFNSTTNTAFDSLVVGNGVTVQDQSGFSSVGINSRSLDSITNNGSILSYTNTNFPNNAVKIDNSTVNQIDNNGTITQGVNILNNSTINTFNNAGDLSNGIYSNISHIGEFNNAISGKTTNITLDNATISTINNSGKISNYLQIDNGSSVGVVNNLATGNIRTLFLNATSLPIVNNYGYIEQVSVQNGAVMNQINNNAGGNIQLVFLNNGINLDHVNNDAGAQIGSIQLLNSNVTTINNSGSISNGIFNGPAISIDGSSSVGEINNSGLIKANGDVPAIYYSNTNNNTLNLQPGSQIVGLIDFGTGTGNVVNLEPGTKTNAVYQFNGNYALNLPETSDPNLVILNNDHGLAVLNKSSLTPPSIENTSNLGNTIDKILSVRSFGLYLIGSDEENSTTKLASNENKNSKSDAVSDLGIKTNQEQPFFWSEAFGSYNEKSSYKGSPTSESSLAGVIFGADKPLDSKSRMGGFLGYLNGSTNISGNQNIDSKGIFLGSYLNQNRKPYFNDFSLIVGFLQDDNSDGSGIFSGYNNAFVTTSATIGKKLDAIPAVTSATLRYTGQWVDNSEENVADSTVTVNSRYLNAISGRLEIRSNDKIIKISQGKLNIIARAGLEANKLIGNQKVSITVIDETVSVTPNQRDYNIDGFVGGNVSYDLKNDVKAYVDLEASKGITKNLSNNNLGLLGKVGFKWNF